MIKKVFLVAVLFTLLPMLLLAQEGKLRGVVTDKETGEPLPGANVIIEGTQLGSAADLNGVYIVLGVPPGVYSVRTDYIGYQSVTISNIRVSAGITTTLDFQLSSQALQMESVQIVAERPLIQRNTTNTVRMTTEEDIKNLPIRGLQNLVSLEAGTVQQNGTLHIRGGRAGEVAYFVDGITGTNPLFNNENVTVIQEAIEEIQTQTGGYTAEEGGANSGVVKTILRTGGSKFKASLDYRTDDFAKPGDQFLNTSSYGYRNAVLTLSGPVPWFGNKMRFFLAGQHNYRRNRNPSYVEPFEFRDLTDDGFSGRTVGDTLPQGGVVKYKRNHLPGNYFLDNMGQGTLVYQATNNIKLRLTGSYQYQKWPTQAGNFYSNLYNYFNMHRLPRATEKTTMLGLRATHLISENTFYDVGVYFSDRSRETVDPVFGSNWPAYVDSIANFNAGYGRIYDPENDTWSSSWVSRYQGPRQLSTINGFRFDPPDAPINSYSKDSQTNLGANLDFVSQVTKQWELRLGGRLDTWIMRRYSVGTIRQFMQTAYGVRGTTPQPYASDYERMVDLAKAGAVTFIGWDVDGKKKINSGVYGPNKPVFASAYVQNKFEYRDLVLNVGVRYERVDLKALKPINPEAPLMDTENDWLDPKGVTRTKAYNYLLPRFNFSFPVTDRTVFYALYGRYIQMPRLNQVYRGYRLLSQSVSPVTRSPYGFWSSYVGYTAKPEEIVQYEMGIREALTDNFAFTLTSFYKNYNNQLRIDKIYAQGLGTVAEGNVIFSGYRNNDFSTVKGIEFTLELRRTKRLAARVNYTLSNARGTNSSPRAGEVVVSDEAQARYPVLMYPLDYNQPHRGTVMLDYRFSKGDGGPILQGLGLNLLVTFNSGHAYTKIKEPQNLGQASPWNIGVRAMRDPRGRNPEEPLNSSYTPWNFNVDLNMDKVFFFDRFNIDLYVHVLNLFDTKNVINVYNNTGTAEDDGWLRSPFATPFYAIPNYVDFYRTINLQNRWAYEYATGLDVYGTPRQIRFGIRLELK